MALKHKMPHTATRPGKKVRVKLRSGEVIIDRFEDRNDTYVFLRRVGRVRKSDIVSFSDYKPQPQVDGRKPKEAE